MTFGEKVKNERNRLGLNQDELAKKIGVTRRVISSYENDSSRPRGTERYKKLAEALGVNINYLLSEDEAFIAEVDAIQEAYLIAKKNNKKYTPKKYRKDE